MPLDLPPPLPPQQADVAVLEERHAIARARDDVLELKVGQYSLLVSGNTYLSEKRIREVTSVARTPSQVILLLNALYAAEGYLLVNVQYGREGNNDTIYVQVNEGRLVEVDAPPALAPYFERFENQPDLREQDVEPMRVLAQLKADRAGYAISSEYSVSQSDPGAYTLTLDGEHDPEHDPFEFATVFGNPGNRFLGRYFGLANARFYTPGGDAIGLNYATAFTGLGDTRGGESYDRYELSYQTVTTLGLYGASASFTEYKLSDRFGFGEHEKANIVEVALTGSQFLYADDKTRWALEERLEYIDSTIEFTDADGLFIGNEPAEGQRYQDEQYGAFRLGTSLSRSWHLFSRRGSLNGGFGYKRGFGGAIRNLADTKRRNDFNLFDGNLTLRYQLPLELLASLHLKGQLTANEQVPQQEQWVLGGPDNLSAYLPGIMVGDTGAYGRFQIQLPRWTLFDRPYRFSAFVEAGTAQYEDTSGDLGLTRRAADAGVKLEVAPADWLELTLHAAEGFDERNLDIGRGEDFVEDNQTNFFFSVKASF